MTKLCRLCNKPSRKWHGRLCYACQSRITTQRQTKRGIRYAEIYDKKTHARRLLSTIRKKCKEKNIKFNLSIYDIVIPEYCPVLGFKIMKGSGSPTDVTTDRIRPELGYVKGNIIIVSRLANQIKSTGTSEQIATVARFYARLGV